MDVSGDNQSYGAWNDVVERILISYHLRPKSDSELFFLYLNFLFLNTIFELFSYCKNVWQTQLLY